MSHYLKWMSVLLAGAVFSGAQGFAQDKATLDLLVKKGVISQDEAAAVAKQSSMVVLPKEKTTKKLTISGRIQTQFDYINTDNNAPGAADLQATQQFLLRRVNVGLAADLGNGVKGVVDMDFAAGQGGTTQATGGTVNNFDKVYIAKTFEDIGTVRAGFDKVNFIQEENTSSSRLKPIERSLATRYFSENWNGNSQTRRLGFGSRHTGLFWEGDIPQVNGLSYSLALTNGQQSNSGFGAGNGGMGYWLGAAYEGAFDEVKYTLGVNSGYSQNANSTATATPMLDMWGVNPYAKLQWRNFELPAEFILASVQDGRAGGGDAIPWGVNITPSYKFTKEWEGVVRFSYLDTDGRGIRVSDGVRNAPSPSINYDKAYAIYVGVNWYIIGTALKVSAGYEYARFSDALGTNTTADANALRAQVQLLF